MKTTMKKTAAYLLAMLLVLQVLPALSEEVTSNTQGPIQSFREKLEVTSGTSILTVGQTISLTWTEGYDNLKWKSNNPDIATVQETEEGVTVTGVAEGTVKITASEDDYADSITLKVMAGKHSEESEKTDDSGKETQEEAPEEENIVILINGSKDKVTYDGQEHTTSYTVDSNSASFDPASLTLNHPEHLATGKDGGVYKDQLTEADFTYTGVGNAEIIVSNGWLQIKPASVTVTANDLTVAEGESPIFTATVEGLVDGEDADAFVAQYITFETMVSGNVTYIMPVAEGDMVGNYRVKAKSGVLTVAEATPLRITISSDWPAGEPAYAGTEITLTAHLSGFEHKTYTLQWQYSDDNRQTWTDQPGETGLSMTYVMSETTANYIWRVVARNVKDQ